MISVRVGSYRFQYRAAAIIIDESHLLLHRLEGDEFWALPGGRVNPGEQAQNAILREFVEELGVSVECGPLLCVGENFFEYGGEPHHELGLYFAVTLEPGSPLSFKERVHMGHEGSRALEFKWFALRELSLIDFRPSALRNALASGSPPLHFVQES